MDFFKRTALFTIGVGSILEERIIQFAEEMVKRGKLTKEEAKTFTEDFINKSKEKADEIQKNTEERLTETFEKIGFVKKEKLDIMEARIKELEEELKRIKEKIE